MSIYIWLSLIYGAFAVVLVAVIAVTIINWRHHRAAKRANNEMNKGGR